MCPCLTLYCTHYFFIARRQIRCYRTVTLCSRGLSVLQLTAQLARNRLCHHCFTAGGAEPQEGSVLAQTWTTWGLRCSAPMPRWSSGWRRGDSGTGYGAAILLHFCSCFLLVISCQIAQLCTQLSCQQFFTSIFTQKSKQIYWYR